MDESFQRPDPCKTSVKLVDVLKIVAFAVIQLDAGHSAEVGARRPNFGMCDVFGAVSLMKSTPERNGHSELAAAGGYWSA
jgi:hypothetical protein